MRVTVIGCGHLGATHAAGMAEIGHEVIGVDVAPDKIDMLSQGRAWFHEPGLDELLSRHTASGRLRFTTDFAEAASFGEVHFLGVGTPGLADRPAYDTSQLRAAVRSLAPHLTKGCVIVGKSTVSVGTTAWVTDLVHELAPAGEQVEVSWNPEFLREGLGVQDTLRPDRLVVGVASPAAEKTLRAVYQPLIDSGVPLVVCDPETAELVKSAANAFLTTKISFINAIAELCEAAGADVEALTRALSLDDRIGGKSLHAGLGYGGGCLPKDTRALIARAEDLGVDEAVQLLRTVDGINEGRRARIVDIVTELLGGSVARRRITVWGASFKPNTDDIRDSPALDVAAQLYEAGAVVTCYDPQAIDNARVKHPELVFADSAVEAAHGAEVVVLATEWPEFTHLAPQEVSSVVTQPVIVDARNALPLVSWQSAGWQVRRMGAALDVTHDAPPAETPE